MKIRFKISTTILSVLACFVGLPEIEAAPQITPPPDGCYPGFTTAEGCLALQNLTTGTGNTGVGWRSLFLVGGASFNTGVGAGTLVLNTADSNTAVGAAAMMLNFSGDDNTAVGVSALAFNSGGEDNTAVGSFALSNNDSTKAGLASNNTAVGAEALEFNTDGNPNTAIGYAALNSNLTAGGNTAVGYERSCLMTSLQTASHLAGTTMLSAPMRSLVTLTDTATMLLAPTRFSSMLMALQTPPLVIIRSGIMTRMHSVWPITTRQLALWRSSVTLMAVRTQPSVQAQDKT